MKKIFLFLIPLFILVGCDTSDDELPAEPSLTSDDFQLVSVEAKLADYKGEFYDFQLNLFYEDDKISKVVDSSGETFQLIYDNKGRLIADAICEDDGCYDNWVYEYDEQDRLIKTTYLQEEKEASYFTYEYPALNTILQVKHEVDHNEVEENKFIFENGNYVKGFTLVNLEWAEDFNGTYDNTLTYPSSFKNFQEVYWEDTPFKNKNLLTHGKGNFGNDKTEINLTYSFDEHGNLTQIREAEGEIYNFIYKQLK